MGFEKGLFGSSDGSNVLEDVSNHYGEKFTGGGQGRFKTEGAENEAVVNYNNEELDKVVVIPAGATVIEIIDNFATGAVTVATVGGVDISGADGASANYVDLPLGGDLVVTGPTAGKVIVKYLNG